MATPKKSVPSVKSVSKSSAAKSAKPAEIREDLENILLCDLTPAERDHVALGIDKTFHLTVSFTLNGIVVYLWQDGRLCSQFDGRTTTCDQLWAACERLRPQDAEELANTTVQITHAGRIALAAQDIIDGLFSSGTRLVIEEGTKLNGRGWGKEPAIDQVTAILRKRLPDPAASVSSVSSVVGFPQAQPGTTAARIVAKCAELAEFLLGKNKSYGDSALNPIRVFSRATARQGLETRADDKLARLQNAPGAYGDNDVKDLTGYLIFLLIQDDLDRESSSGTTARPDGNGAQVGGKKPA